MYTQKIGIGLIKTNKKLTYFIFVRFILDKGEKGEEGKMNVSWLK